MPVTTGKYANNETICYQYITGTAHMSTAVACGILANIERESSFNNTDTNSSSGAYGLIQWLGGRKTNLINHCKKLGVDKSNVRGQLSFLFTSTEFSPTGDSNNKKAYNLMVALPNTKNGAYNAGLYFSQYFERHGNKTEDQRRANLAAEKYWSYYSSGAVSGGTTTITSSLNIGQRIVVAARAQIGKPRKVGASGPDEFDDVGLCTYSYKQAGYNLGNMSRDSLYTLFATKGRSVTVAKASAGDLLFYKASNSTNKLTLVAIATGDGGRILASPETNTVREVEGLASPVQILRYVSDTQTSQGAIPEDTISIGSSDYTGVTEFLFVGGPANNYTSLTTSEDYSSLQEVNLSTASASGYDYGYLIDMTYGGTFKFYIPEFSEAAGSNWSQVSILGRSVSLVSYQYTASRKVTISLDLYAGAGIYNDPNSSDIVGKLHSDANFVKSLEYPDYSNAIARPPSKVHLILGSAFNMIGVVSDVQVAHQKPLDSQNRAMYIKLSFTVTQIAPNPPDYKDIRNGQYSLISSKNSSISSSGSTVESTNNPSGSSSTITTNSNVGGGS